MDLYTDAAMSRKNDVYGLGGVGYYTNDPERALFTFSYSWTDRPVQGVNFLEYQALIAGLELASSIGVRRIYVYSDSEVVVNQLNGAYTVRDEGLKQCYRRALYLLDLFAMRLVTHIPRELNGVADALSGVPTGKTSGAALARAMEGIRARTKYEGTRGSWDPDQES